MMRCNRMNVLMKNTVAALKRREWNKSVISPNSDWLNFIL